MEATITAAGSNTRLVGALVRPYNNNNSMLRIMDRFYDHQHTTTKLRRYCSTTTTSCTKAFHMMSGGLKEAISAGMPTSVPVRVAHELLLAGHKYLDVRTEEEFNAGHPVGAINIPYMYKVGTGMTKNPKFVDQVCSHFRKYDEIIVGCRSGKRSIMAATNLLASGYTGVTDMAGGYEAWTRNTLPTSQPHHHNS